MHLTTFTNIFIWLECLFCSISLILLARAGQARRFGYLTAFLAVRVAFIVMVIPVMENMRSLPFSRMAAYNFYFWTYWPMCLVEAYLAFGIVVNVYRLAMEPLKGLQTLGMLMFRWAFGISLALTVIFGLGPHLSTHEAIMRSVLELQQMECILTLCMLVFVCFAVHPMGLSYRSRIFGVGLGLGCYAATDLVTSAWAQYQHQNTALTSLLNTAASVMCAMVWCGYLALPEPKRKMILLPTISPFFRWNQISEALGAKPGYVAVGPVGLDMFAPAELEVMRRASDKMPSESARQPADKVTPIRVA